MSDDLNIRGGGVGPVGPGGARFNAAQGDFRLPDLQGAQGPQAPGGAGASGSVGQAGRVERVDGDGLDACIRDAAARGLGRDEIVGAMVAHELRGRFGSNVPEHLVRSATEQVLRDPVLSQMADKMIARDRDSAS